MPFAGPALALVALLASGCAATQSGWVREDARVCGASPRVCVASDPDRAATFEVGGVALIPGECAAPRDAGRSAWVTVTIDEAGTRRRRTLRGSSRRLRVVKLEPRDDARSRIGIQGTACPSGQPVEVSPTGLDVE